MIQVKPLASSSRGNAHLLTSGAAPALLLEAGLPFKELQKRIWAHDYTTNRIAGCLISHEHGDHSIAADALASYGVWIYTSQGTADALASRFGFRSYCLIPKEPRQQFMIGPWGVMPFETVHDAAEPFGFLITDGMDKLVYITDTAYVPVKFQGLTIAMIECNYEAALLTASRDTHPEIKTRVIKNHFGLEQVKRFFLANDTSNLREVWLLHLSGGHSDAARFKNEIQKITGAPVYIAEE